MCRRALQEIAVKGGGSFPQNIPISIDMNGTLWIK